MLTRYHFATRLKHVGFEVVALYADTMSGARSDRAALAAVLTVAHVSVR
jgi:hypothetical protein